MLEAAKGNRWGHRDAAMLLVAYRHGFLEEQFWLRSDPSKIEDKYQRSLANLEPSTQGPKPDPSIGPLVHPKLRGEPGSTFQLRRNKR
jgi:hypothetical protein